MIIRSLYALDLLKDAVYRNAICVFGAELAISKLRASVFFSKHTGLGQLKKILCPKSKVRSLQSPEFNVVSQMEQKQFIQIGPVAG